MNLNIDGGIHYSVFFAAIFILSLMFGAFKEMSKKKKKLYLFLVFGIFFVLIGFRSIDIGNDTRSYVALFERLFWNNSLSEAIKQSGTENGFIIYEWIIGNVFGDARYLLIITSFIINYSIGRFVYKYVDCPGIFCLMFVGLTRFDFFLSAMRQGLSIAIILFAFDYLINNKKKTFFVLTLFACYFHTSSVIIFLIYPFINKVIDKKEIDSGSDSYFYLSMCFAAVICSFFLDPIAVRVIRFFPRYMNYLGGRTFEGEPRLAAILITLVYFLFHFVPKPFIKKCKHDVRLYSLFDRLSLFTVAISFISINATILSRFSSTFCLFFFAFFSNCFNCFKKSEKVFWVLIVAICVFVYGLIIVIYKTPSWNTTYPIELAWEV